jgi:hypothetical protein
VLLSVAIVFGLVAANLVREPVLRALVRGAGPPLFVVEPTCEEFLLPAATSSLSSV